MNKKSLLRLMKLVIVMAAVLLAMMPVSAMADDGGTVDENGMSATKHARVLDDGTYIIDLEAFATGEAHFDTVTVPADIILVLDVSGSMKDPMGQSSYQYVARTSQEYSYIDYRYADDYYYYKHTDGEYYQVREGRFTTGYGSSSVYHYCLYYSVNGTIYYLSESDVTTTRPERYTHDDDVIWKGVLYEYTWVPAPSKMTALKDAVNTFVDEVALKNKEAADAMTADGGTLDENKLSRIAIVKFAENATYRKSSFANYKNNIILYFITPLNI